MAFKRGYQPLAKEAKRQEAERESRTKRFREFFLTADDDEAEIQFLLEEPLVCRTHTVQERTSNGSRYNTYLCTEDDNCPYCADGEKTSMKGATLVLDRRPFKYRDDNGKEKTNKNGQIKIYLAGTRVMGQLERLSRKYGLVGRDIVVFRQGTGTSTTYNFERGDENELSESEIRKLLPEWCRDEYDGTDESLYAILEEQLSYMNPVIDEEEDGDEDDERPARCSVKKSSGRKSCYADDEDYDEVEEDDDDDDEEEEPPRKKSRLGAKKRIGRR